MLRCLVSSVAILLVATSAAAQTLPPAPGAPPPAATGWRGQPTLEPGWYPTPPGRDGWRAPRPDTTRKAKRPGDNFTARPLALLSHSSLGGPFGFIGVSADYTLASWLSMEAGGGYSAAPETSAMIRPRLPLAPGFVVGFGTGATASFGFEDVLGNLCLMCEGEQTPPDHWSVAKFVNGEVFVEGRTGIGITVRGTFGYWKILNPTPDVCHGTCDPIESPSEPYFGIAVGEAL